MVTSTKIRDAFNESARIYNLITKKLDYVEDSGFNFMRQLLLTGFQLDVSNISSGNNENS